MIKSTLTVLRSKALVVALAALGVSHFATAAPQARIADTQSAVGALVHFSGVDDGQSYGRFIVKYRGASASASASPQAMSSAFAAIDRVANAFGQNLGHVRRLATGADLVEVRGARLNADNARALLAQFGNDPNVEYVEADAQMVALLTPNDTRYNEQWHFFEATAGMNLPSAWDINTGGGVTVAIIDTGITPHSDLSGNVVAGYDFVSDATAARDGNGRDSNPNDEGDWYNAGECGQPVGSSSSWHGTHVAGTVAAVSNNASGVAGVAFNARVQPVRVLAKCGGSLADIADAIVWASGGTVSGIPANPTPSRVINMSLGGSGACGSTYQSAIDSAVGRGTVVAVAAGNSNANASNARPANCNNVITVAAIDRQGNRAAYSNFGTVVDVGAPGGETATASNGVLSTLNTGSTTQGSATYAFYQGTSMATPHVAGLAALVLSLNGTLTPAQVETFIKNNTRALAGTCSGGCGTGLVNAVATLQAVGGGGGNAAPTANFSFTTSGLTANFTDGSSDSDGTIASRSWTFGDGGTSTATNPSRTYAAAGTYSVQLTVTDDDGATNSITKAVTVTAPGGTQLSNGVPVTGLSGAAGSQVFHTVAIPSGASNLSIQISGGTGDADLYVRFGSPPTTSTYNCRPYLNGNNETCTFAAPSVGTYHVMLRAFSAYAGVTLRATWTEGGGGPSFFENQTDFSINDNATIESPIAISGRAGNAPAALQVAVTIFHTYKGDLKVDLVAPDGSVYVLHNRTGGSADNIIQTFTVNASSEVANGTWKLRVNDNANADTGTLDKWSLQF